MYICGWELYEYEDEIKNTSKLYLKVIYKSFRIFGKDCMLFSKTLFEF